jgi:hypothetical protein
LCFVAALASCKKGALCVVLEGNFELAASRLTVSQQTREKMAFYGRDNAGFGPRVVIADIDTGQFLTL